MDSMVTGAHGHRVLIHVAEDLNQDYENVIIHFHNTVEDNAMVTIKIIYNATLSRVQ